MGGQAARRLYDAAKAMKHLCSIERIDNLSRGKEARAAVDLGNLAGSRGCNNSDPIVINTIFDEVSFICGTGDRAYCDNSGNLHTVGEVKNADQVQLEGPVAIWIPLFEAAGSLSKELGSRSNSSWRDR